MTEQGQLAYSQQPYGLAPAPPQWPYPPQQPPGQPYYAAQGYQYDPAYYQYYQQYYYGSATPQTTTAEVIAPPLPAANNQPDQTPPPPPGEPMAPPLPSEPAPPTPPATTASAQAPLAAVASAPLQAAPPAGAAQYDSNAYNQYYQQQPYYQGYYQQYGYGSWPGYAAPQSYQQTASAPQPQPPASAPPLSSGMAAPSISGTRQTTPSRQLMHPSTCATLPTGTVPTASQLPSSSGASTAPAPPSGFNVGKPRLLKPQLGPINFTIKPKIPKKSAEETSFVKVASAEEKPAFVKVEDKPSAETTASRSQWPPSLKSFVERAFSKCRSETDRQKVQVVLRHIITNASEKGELWTRDWDTTPLPDLDNRQPTPPETGNRPKNSRWSDAQSKQRDEPAAFVRQHSKGQKPLKEKKPPKRRVTSSDDSEDEIHTHEDHKRRQRAGRFGNGAAVDVHNGSRVKGNSSKKQRVRPAVKRNEGAGQELDWDDMIIKGTNQQLEKSYFRLTSAPDPASVRPEFVLHKALDRLVRILRSGTEKYLYALDQFKGMRQDLTVQHIKNELTVRVYEAHARAALEYGDTAEFNQCQTQLDLLYGQGLLGSRHEFLSYRILYQTIHAKLGEAAGLLNTLKKLTKEDTAHPAVAHALKVRKAVYSGDYVAFFKLYRKAPGLGRCLMDLHIRKMRFKALDAIVRAYRPSISVSLVSRLLGFFVEQEVEGQSRDETVLPGCSRPAYDNGHHRPLSDVEDAMEACLSCVAASAGVITGNSTAEAVLDCKASVGQLVIPEDTTAVAHGDANLAIDDFLSRAMLE